MSTKHHAIQKSFREFSTSPLPFREPCDIPRKRHSLPSLQACNTLRSLIARSCGFSKNHFHAHPTLCRASSFCPSPSAASWPQACGATLLGGTASRANPAPHRATGLARSRAMAATHSRSPRPSQTTAMNPAQPTPVALLCHAKAPPPSQRRPIPHPIPHPARRFFLPVTLSTAQAQLKGLNIGASKGTIQGPFSTGLVSTSCSSTAWLGTRSLVR
jgi:hypothetical protein